MPDLPDMWGRGKQNPYIASSIPEEGDMGFSQWGM